MIATFDTLPDTSRIWIYQSPRPFAEEEKDFISSKLQEFMNQWNSHGKDLTGQFEIRDDQFIVIAVDEEMAGASGCSIDSSVNTIKSIGSELRIDLLDKSTVSFKEDSIQSVPFQKVKGLVEEGIIKPQTLIYDLSITSLGSYRNHWPVEADTTWVKRYF